MNYFIFNDNHQVVELWYCPNPYDKGEYRHGKLMGSYESK